MTAGAVAPACTPSDQPERLQPLSFNHAAQRLARTASKHQSGDRFAEAGIGPSVGSVGDSYDNALAESINGLYKTEVIRRRGPWRSLEAVEFATLEWVEWFNNRRLLEPIGNIPPAEAEACYYKQFETHAMAASLNETSLRQTRRDSTHCLVRMSPLPSYKTRHWGNQCNAGSS